MRIILVGLGAMVAASLIPRQREREIGQLLGFVVLVYGIILASWRVGQR